MGWVWGRARAKPRPALLPALSVIICLRPPPLPVKTFILIWIELAVILPRGLVVGGGGAGSWSKSEASGSLMDTSAPEPAASISKGRTVGLESAHSLTQRLPPTLPSWDATLTVACTRPPS